MLNLVFFLVYLLLQYSLIIDAAFSQQLLTNTKTMVLLLRTTPQLFIVIIFLKIYIFFKFYHSTFGLLKIKIYNLLSFTFYIIILVSFVTHVMSLVS